MSWGFWVSRVLLCQSLFVFFLFLFHAFVNGYAMLSSNSSQVCFFLGISAFIFVSKYKLGRNLLIWRKLERSRVFHSGSSK